MDIATKKDFYRRKYVKLQLQKLKEREAILLEELEKCKKEIENKWEEFNTLREEDGHG